MITLVGVDEGCRDMEEVCRQQKLASKIIVFFVPSPLNHPSLDVGVSEFPTAKDGKDIL